MKPNRNFAPLQYNFCKNWYTTIVPLYDRPKVAKVIKELRKEYMGLADVAVEHLQDYPELAEAEVVLMEHTFIVKIKDLSWLRDALPPWGMGDLSLAFAEELYPDDEWEILEYEEFFVVTNSNHSIVFDLEHFNRLSGAASLAKCGVTEGIPDTAVLEFHRMMEAQNQRAQHTLDIMQKHLAMAIEEDESRDGNVVSLNQETPPEN